MSSYLTEVQQQGYLPNSHHPDADTSGNGESDGSRSRSPITVHQHVKPENQDTENNSTDCPEDLTCYRTTDGGGSGQEAPPPLTLDDDDARLRPVKRESSCDDDHRDQPVSVEPQSPTPSN